MHIIQLKSFSRLQLQKILAHKIYFNIKCDFEIIIIMDYCRKNDLKIIISQH